MGGSQGARRINQAVWSALDELLERFEEVIHFTGPQGEKQAVEVGRSRYRVCPFSDEVPRLMGAAACGRLDGARDIVGVLEDVVAWRCPSLRTPLPAFLCVGGKAGRSLGEGDEASPPDGDRGRRGVGSCPDVPRPG